jgi:hypothetical protein
MRLEDRMIKYNVQEETGEEVIAGGISKCTYGSKE